MTTGTKSLLFGVHQVFWHPVTVWLAWWKLYGEFPNWRETVCIIVHDWGYWGCSDMDGQDGEYHPGLGALIAGWLFDADHYELVYRHSRFLAKKDGAQPSKLCWADKASMQYDPAWFYLLRASLSGELWQYRQTSVKRNTIGEHVSHWKWFHHVRDTMWTMATEQGREFKRPDLDLVVSLAEEVPYTVRKGELMFAEFAANLVQERTARLSRVLNRCGHVHLAKAVCHGVYWCREIAALRSYNDGLGGLRRLEISAVQPGWSWNRVNMEDKTPFLFVSPNRNRFTPNLAALARRNAMMRSKDQNHIADPFNPHE